jgi:hypothetical protein
VSLLRPVAGAYSAGSPAPYSGGSEFQWPAILTEVSWFYLVNPDTSWDDITAASLHFIFHDHSPIGRYDRSLEPTYLRSSLHNSN